MDPRLDSVKLHASRRQDFSLLEHLNARHPPIMLAELIDWDAIERVAHKAIGFTHRRRPSRPVAGMLYLQRTFDLWDEEVFWG